MFVIDNVIVAIAASLDTVENMANIRSGEEIVGSAVQSAHST